MAGRVGRATWNGLLRLSRARRVQNVATIGLVVLAPCLPLATFLLLGPLDQGSSAISLRLVLLADLVYVLVVATLVLGRIARMIAARRARSAGSRLHLRLTGVFALIALIPTVTVAVFAGLTVNVGLEGWFSDRVQRVVGASLTAAEAYQSDQRADLVEDVEALARFLNQSRNGNVFLSDGDIRQLLTQGQGLVQRGLREAYVIDGTAQIRSRGEGSYLFEFEKPTDDDMSRALEGEVVVTEDATTDEFRALMRLEGFVDRFLYVSRDVDGRILSLLDDAAETATLYRQLEAERGRLLFDFALFYLGFAVILILAAIWLGLWFAERLSRPVGRLAGAAQRVGAGDLNVQVVEEEGDDEIAMLGRLFNQMTKRLKEQRDALLANNRQIERRRRLFDSVLSSVTAGVIGLDADGQISFINRSAERILGLDRVPDVDMRLGQLIPEFEGLLDKLRATRKEVAQEEIRLVRSGRAEDVLVRIATRRNDLDKLEGYVIAFDDVTDLVTAQRMAAWGDVARRIAHEIKNPLTPIRLSAERIQRKFRDKVGDEREALEQYTEVIVRQTGDLRRIVDEFSKFARMPEPDRTVTDLIPLVRDAVLLQGDTIESVEVTADLPSDERLADIDSTMISQAVINLIKNAGEAIESLKEKGAPDGHAPRIAVAFADDEDTLVVSISDNGIGLPEDRSRLFEPYVTTRKEGTGLGLSIVKKIIEEHGGTLTLTDAAPLDDSGKIGARAEIRLPKATKLTTPNQATPLKVAE